MVTCDIDAQVVSTTSARTPKFEILTFFDTVSYVLRIDNRGAAGELRSYVCASVVQAVLEHSMLMQIPDDS